VGWLWDHDFRRKAPRLGGEFFEQRRTRNAPGPEGFGQGGNKRLLGNSAGKNERNPGISREGTLKKRGKVGKKQLKGDRKKEAHSEKQVPKTKKKKGMSKEEKGFE